MNIGKDFFREEQEGVMAEETRKGASESLISFHFQGDTDFHFGIDVNLRKLKRLLDMTKGAAVETAKGIIGSLSPDVLKTISKLLPAWLRRKKKTPG